MNQRSAKRAARRTVLGSLGLALITSPCHGATVDVTVSSNTFSPSTVRISAGDTVRWLWQGGSHTVTSGSNCSADGTFEFNAAGSSNIAGSFTFSRAGTYAYFCRPHCQFGMTGQVVVAEAARQPTVTALTNPIPATVRKGAIEAKLQPIVRGLTAPNWGTTAPGDSSRLFVSDQIGTIWAIDLSTRQKSVFGNVKSLLVKLGVFGSAYDERGLLGLAFHPNYQSNGLLYTYTSERRRGTPDFSTLAKPKTADHHNVIREWHVPNQGDPSSVIDPTSSRVVMRINHPQFNHDGGALVFGPDGLLYIAVGDGGNADDQGPGHRAGGNGQALNTVLGKILRIDPNATSSANGQYGIPGSNPFAQSGATGGQAGCSDGQCDEIYAYGLRNPFRISFDSNNTLNTFFAGDVGQNNVEEIDVISSGSNYGWRKKEGSFCFHTNGSDPGTVSAATDCSSAGLTDPIAQYDHDEGNAIVGGFVYRGALLPALSGHYVFGDYTRTGNANGRLFYLQNSDIAPSDTASSSISELKLRGRKKLGLAVLGFGQDSAGEVYVLANRTGTPSGRTGVVFKLSN